MWLLILTVSYTRKFDKAPPLGLDSLKNPLLSPPIGPM